MGPTDQEGARADGGKSEDRNRSLQRAEDVGQADHRPDHSRGKNQQHAQDQQVPDSRRYSLAYFANS